MRAITCRGRWGRVTEWSRHSITAKRNGHISFKKPFVTTNNSLVCLFFTVQKGAPFDTRLLTGDQRTKSTTMTMISLFFLFIPQNPYMLPQLPMKYQYQWTGMNTATNIELIIYIYIHMIHAYVYIYIYMEFNIIIYIYKLYICIIQCIYTHIYIYTHLSIYILINQLIFPPLDTIPHQPCPTHRRSSNSTPPKGLSSGILWMSHGSQCSNRYHLSIHIIYNIHIIMLHV